MAVGRIPKRTTAAMPGLTATITELNYCDGVTSNIQTQLDAKTGSSGGTIVVDDHGTAATDEVINICYGTGAAPTASTVTEGGIFFKYVA